VGTAETSPATVADRSAETLLAIIKACILPGTTVVTDCWQSNDRLGSAGFAHHAVDRCVGLVDSCMDAHTNTIEDTWKNVKVHLRPF